MHIIQQVITQIVIITTAEPAMTKRLFPLLDCSLFIVSAERGSPAVWVDVVLKEPLRAVINDVHIPKATKTVAMVPLQQKLPKLLLPKVSVLPQMSSKMNKVSSKSVKRSKRKHARKKKATNAFKSIFVRNKKFRNNFSNSHSQNSEGTKQAPHQKKLQYLAPSNSKSHSVEYSNCSATISISQYDEPSNEVFMDQLSLYTSVLSENSNQSENLTTTTQSSDERMKSLKSNSKSIQFDTFDIFKNPKYISAANESFDDNNNQTFLVSSKGLRTGYHEFDVKVLQSGFYSQEIGVVSNAHICTSQHNTIEFNGIGGTRQFGARSVYGNELMTESLYYSSYNDDGGTRCYKDLMLSSKYNQSWSSGDVIKVCLDLDRHRITYYLNDVRVRKSVSLQIGKTYFPIISFVGNCRYSIMRISDSEDTAYCE